MTAARTDLTKGDIKGHLIRMTIPMIWGIAAIISFQLVDTYYVSLLGTQYLAAMSFTFPVTLMIFSIIMGFGISVSSVVSRLIGEGKQEDVRRVTSHALILVFSVGCLISALGLLLHDKIFESMGADADMRALIHDYMSIWLLGVPFLALPFSGNSAIRASGSATIPAIIMVTSAILNAIIAPFLIYGWAGLPQMALQGAAIATVFCQFLSAVAVLYVLSRAKKMVLPLRNLQLFHFKDSFKRIIFIALAAGLTSAIGPLVSSFIVSILADFGTEAVAAFGIASRVEAFAFIILMALAVGMGPVIGQNYGARQWGRVDEALRMAIGFSVLWCIGVAIVLMIFAQPIANLFSDDPIVLYYAKMCFFVLAPSYLFASLMSGWSSAFNALGRPQISLMMTLIRMVAVTVPSVIIGANLAGVFGVFMGMALSNIGCGLAFHVWAKRIMRGEETKLALKTP